MVPIGIGYEPGRLNIADAILREEQPAVAQEAEHIASVAVSDDFAIDGEGGDLGGAGSFDPGFDGEVLELETGRIADPHTITVPVKREGLPDPAGGEGGIAAEAAVVGAADVGGVASGRPPTDQAGRRAGANRTGPGPDLHSIDYRDPGSTWQDGNRQWF